MPKHDSDHAADAHSGGGRASRWSEICAVHEYAELLKRRQGKRLHGRLWTAHNGASLCFEAWPAVCRAAGSDRVVGSVEPRTPTLPIFPWDRL